MRTTCVRNIFGMEAIYERQGGFFCCIKNTILDSDSNGSGTELSEILETIEKQQFLDPAAACCRRLMKALCELSWRMRMR